MGLLGSSQVVNPFTKYALTITPVAHSLEELLPQRPDSQEYRSWSLVIRTTLVLSTIAVAVLVPFFGNLSSVSVSVSSIVASNSLLLSSSFPVSLHLWVQI